MIEPSREFVFSEIREISASPRAWVTHWVVPAKCSYFEGHFPGFPVLPAVGMIDATLELLRKSTGIRELSLKELKSAKFLKPVSPQQGLEITLTESGEEQWRAQWRDSAAPDPAQALVADLLLLTCVASVIG